MLDFPLYVPTLIVGETLLRISRLPLCEKFVQAEIRDMTNKLSAYLYGKLNSDQYISLFEQIFSTVKKPCIESQSN